MQRAPLACVLATLAATAACDIDAPVAPVAASQQATPTLLITSLATVLGKTVVDEPGEVGEYASLASSSDGTQRIAYRDKTNHRLKYAGCASSCRLAANWQTGVIDQSADVGEYASLRVKSGVRHVVYYDRTNRDLKYAVCSAECYIHSNWRKGAIAQTGFVGQSASLAIDGAGRLHVSYVDEGLGTLKYATCSSDCTLTRKWQRITADASTIVLATGRTSLAISADGRRHISYASVGGLRYASCLAACIDVANWQRLTVNASGVEGRHSSLAVDGAGVRHISYLDQNKRDLKYARCAGDCTNSAGWKRVLADSGTSSDGDVGAYTSLAVGSDGKVHVSHVSAGGKLRYVSCASNCLQSASWAPLVVDGGCTVIPCPAGLYTSLKLGGGNVHISYQTFTSRDLKYAELTP